MKDDESISPAGEAASWISPTGTVKAMSTDHFRPRVSTSDTSTICTREHIGNRSNASPEKGWRSPRKRAAQARGLADRHAIKQVDRPLSNAGIVVWDLFAPWVREVVGQRKAIVVAMDWTDFDADNQATLVLSLITRHGRATPLLWLTVDKDELKDQRNDFEDLCLTRLKAILPEGVAVTILADRGFGDVKLLEFLESLGFGYVIRFRGNVHVTAADGETRLAADWVGEKGRARLFCAAPNAPPPATRSARRSASTPRA